MVESWLFIGGYLVQCSGNALLLAQVRTQQSVYGLSVETQIAYLLSTLARCVWALDTRLVETYIAYLELICSVAISAALIFYNYKFNHTNVKRGLKASSFSITSILVLGSALLAILFHPGSRMWSVQILVAFSIYLEAIALLPQLALMRRMVEIEPLTSHSVALLVVSRVLRLGFWISLFLQGESFIGLFIADLLHCALTADYLINWIRKFRPNGALITKF